ncbi:YggS family pyridoxal phosphate-dependent enzyme [Bacillus suaedaesalsae]|uniref:Pyridoxal phosphate homeostasis protein n=1 Tax=Bacillus suaedaesalsae TaxID=2810349 RepID=A0ABS2DJ88_9BACI|nr:YggS family pyridoxal phosphate-dependent enzyme [Bacillus suaedaesalsae]MBM6618533.1 YggS family pyridoxal phosphate-dependent enzyme [Bacillus suaedaesalsae]
MSVKENLQRIQEKITHTCEKVNRNPNEISIIAVTKYVSTNTAKESLKAGVTHLGENREEGLLQKKSELGEKATWHFIGSLQTRKVKNIVNEVSYIHSLDRISLANEIQKRAKKPVNCFVQVNTSGEDSKHGLSLQEVVPFIKEVGQFDKVKVVGLMTMAPFTDDEILIRNCFSSLRELKVEVQALNLEYAPCTELSMGMSNDYEIAIEEGATYIRIGTSLVGKEF